MGRRRPSGSCPPPGLGHIPAVGRTPPRYQPDWNENSEGASSHHRARPRVLQDTNEDKTGSNPQFPSDRFA